ncbi:hypothetical protein Tco_0248307 [Tanacetum coccineum]
MAADRLIMMKQQIYDSFTTVYLLYGSAGGRVITAAGGRSYNENNRFKRKVATGPQTPLDLGRCDAYGLVTSS